jgi:hypothetical protein
MQILNFFVSLFTIFEFINVKRIGQNDANKFTHHSIKFGIIIPKDEKSIEKTS